MAHPPLRDGGPCPGGPAAPPHPPCSHALALPPGQGRSCCWDVSWQLTASRGFFLALRSAPVPKEGTLPPVLRAELGFLPPPAPQDPVGKDNPTTGTTAEDLQPREEQHGPVQLPQEAQGPRATLRQLGGVWGAGVTPRGPVPRSAAPGTG